MLVMVPTLPEGAGEAAGSYDDGLEVDPFPMVVSLYEPATPEGALYIEPGSVTHALFIQRYKRMALGTVVLSDRISVREA